jgi:hypothetical protein
VDSGAQVSLLPENTSKRLPVSLRASWKPYEEADLNLVGAGGSRINVIGKIKLPLSSPLGCIEEEFVGIRFLRSSSKYSNRAGIRRRYQGECQSGIVVGTTTGVVRYPATLFGMLEAY